MIDNLAIVESKSVGEVTKISQFSHISNTAIIGKNYSDQRWWMDLQQPERKECMELINVKDVLEKIL